MSTWSARPDGDRGTIASAVEILHALQVFGFEVSTAKSGIRPTIDRTFIGMLMLFAEVQHIVVEPVLLIPQSDTRSAHVVHRRRDVHEVLEEFAGHVFVRGIVVASSIAIDSMSRQNIAIQLVPSDCSMKLPGPSGFERSKTPILSRPRKPPSKTFLPSRIFAVHPPREVHQQLMKDAHEKFAVRLALMRAAIL